MEQDLPIYQIRQEFISLLKKENNCVLRAPAASGKSTMLPQFLLDEVVDKEKTVIVLQPRRIAARMLATFVSQIRNCVLGTEVGYQVRLEGASSPYTRLLFLTEGILLQRLLQNDQLTEVGAIVFDEFHERHLETDLALALARKLQVTVRPDLKIIVMSATMEVGLVQQFLGDCKILETTGKSFPVTIRYQHPKPYEPIWDFAALQVESAINDFSEGSVLVFMPGAFEIRKTIEAIKKRDRLTSFEVYPLHGSLSKDDQDQAVRPGGRKIIVTTNVAETSLTIPGIRVVVDSGLARIARFDPKRGINTLFIESIGISSADQRAGRAGRTGPGTCIRMWSEFEHNNRTLPTLPEIHRIDLSEIILRLLASGIDSIGNFTWLERPSQLAIDKSVDLLKSLGALDENNRCTFWGTKMARINVHPRFGRMLVKAEELHCLPSACAVAAIAQSTGVFTATADDIVLQDRLHEFGEPGSDLLFELNAWLWSAKRQFNVQDCKRMGINATVARQVGQLSLQILQQVTSIKDPGLKNLYQGISGDEADKLRECIFTGFVDYLSVRHRQNSPVCQLMYGRSGKLHHESVVQHARLMVATELEEVKSKTGVQLLLRKVTEVDEGWISNLNTYGFKKKVYEEYDPEQKRVVKITEFGINDLVLVRESDTMVDFETASRLLTKAIQGGQLSFPQWDEEVESFVRRVNFASLHAPHYGIPVIDADAREFIIQQSIYHCRSEKEVSRCSLKPALKAWLSYEQRAAVDLVAPVSIELPRRKKPVPLRYDEKGEVILSETIQGLYDCPIPLCVAEGRVEVVFEILAPSRRQVQITRDLDYFWKNSYHQIKKELKGRYPKHEWR
jgi:ATP-dependent helicase HrpB